MRGQCKMPNRPAISRNAIALVLSVQQRLACHDAALRFPAAPVLATEQLPYAAQLESVRGKLGLPVERDMHFAPIHTLAVYARAALNASAITERRDALDAAAAAMAAEDA